MAQVTVELRKLLQLSNFELFDFEYEFDDPKFRAQIEQAVIDYYYNYEIGSETPDEFKRRFEAKWLSIIDYYNQLYNTTLLDYNPLINYKLVEALEQLATSNTVQDSTTDSTSNGTTTQEGTDVLKQTTSTDSTRTDNLTVNTTTSSEGSGNEKTSDYPQQPIAGGDFLEGEKTSTTSTSGTNTTDNTGTQENTGTTTNTGTQTNAGTGTNDSTTTSDNTSVSEDSANTTGTLTSNGTNNTSYEKTLEGITGTSYQELIAKERQNLIRLIPQVINELKPLFILVY